MTRKNNAIFKKTLFNSKKLLEEATTNDTSKQ